MSTAKANRTVSTKAGSPIESDVGNYEQAGRKMAGFSATKATNFEGRRKEIAQNYYSRVDSSK